MATDGQVHKVIRLVATSDSSWEDAARVGVAEAAKSITDLRNARLIESDLMVGPSGVTRYRVKLEVSFQLDRSRRRVGSSETVLVRRYLIIANQTLPSSALHELISVRAAAGPSEFHVLVPEPPRPVLIGDPATGLVTLPAEEIEQQRLLGLAEAEERLDDFRRAFVDLGPAVSGEVGLGDPLTAARRVLERSSFDEIIVSTLPAGVSRWLKLDLPNRLQRSFDLPVVSVVSTGS